MDERTPQLVCVFDVHDSADFCGGRMRSCIVGAGDDCEVDVMTEEAKRVAAGLRYCYRHIHCYSIKDGERCPDYDACQKKVADNVSRNDALADLIESLSEQLEQVTMERDAYLKSIEGLCAACKKAPFCILKPVERCKNWQWRGVGVEG